MIKGETIDEINELMKNMGVYIRTWPDRKSFGGMSVPSQEASEYAWDNETEDAKIGTTSAGKGW